MQLTDQQLFERCHCGHERARHYGYTGQDGMCDRCYCPRFTPRTQEAIETKARLLNITLKGIFDAMPPSTHKAA
jgi:hypothetical protein